MSLIKIYNYINLAQTYLCFTWIGLLGGTLVTPAFWGGGICTFPVPGVNPCEAWPWGVANWLYTPCCLLSGTVPYRYCCCRSSGGGGGRLSRSISPPKPGPPMFMFAMFWLSCKGKTIKIKLENSKIGEIFTILLCFKLGTQDHKLRTDQSQNFNNFEKFVSKTELHLSQWFLYICNFSNSFIGIKQDILNLQSDF